MKRFKVYKWAHKEWVVEERHTSGNLKGCRKGFCIHPSFRDAWLCLNLLIRNTL